MEMAIERDRLFGYKKNKPDMQAAYRPLINATPPTVKIHQFSKMVITFKPIMQF